MWPYWFLFLIPAIAAGMETSAATRRRAAPVVDVAWMGAWLTLVLMIGFRHHVGGDWNAYTMIMLRTRDIGLSEAMQRGDPAFQFLNWFFANWENGIYAVNLASGAIIATGLLVFCRAMPRPWLALATAVPYLVIVVGMGYTRQGIALSLAMIGLVALGKGSIVRFVVWIAAAALFHKSAVLLLPVAALASTQNRYLTGALIALAGAMLYYLLLADEVENLYTNYVVANYQSQGALIRLVMNAVPAALFFSLRNRFDFTEGERRLWTWFAILSLLFLVMYFVTTASTALDRVALYMLPLQVVVFAYLPGAMNQPSVRSRGRSGKASAPGGTRQRVVAFMVIFYYAAVQFVWLNYANHAFAWLPYRFYPLDSGY